MSEYIKNLRTKLGSDIFIHPAARIIIENNKGEYLFIRRGDNNKLREFDITKKVKVVVLYQRSSFLEKVFCL